MQRIHPLSFSLGIASGIVILAIAGGVSHVFSPHTAKHARGTTTGSSQFNTGTMQRMLQGGGGLGGGGARNFQRGS